MHKNFSQKDERRGGPGALYIVPSRIVHSSHEQRNGVGSNGENERPVKNEVDDFLGRFRTGSTGEFNIGRSLDTFLVNLYMIRILPQKLTAPERIGFTVVEWGGTEVQ